ncbi:MAG: hypothetical protein HZA46_02830 [Planctomycetales bacterium]|nr:hypothetical protein [Planctomycetales bacterium]
MNRDHVRPLIAVLGLTAVGWSIAMLISTRAAAQQPRPAAVSQVTAPATQAVPTPHTWVGVSSCAATSCHGRTAPAGSVAAEYTTFITRDPHARAYEVLFNPASVRMASLLREPMRGKPAHESPVCLDCHAPGPHEPARRGRDFDRSFGVGCEACHGPAGDWLNPHTTAAWQARGWQGADEEFKTGLGMIATKDVALRAAACVKCHVGEPGRDVNHDLIAAGHPRLTFEFSSHHARLPKHWRERRIASDPRPRDRDIHPDWDLRVWAVGQIVSARAACELIAVRAATAGSDTGHQHVWPEFADFDCAACHQPVRPPALGARVEFGKTSGELLANDWYVGVVPLAISHFSRDQSASPLVRDLMAQLSQPDSSSASVVEAACKAVVKLKSLERRSVTTALDMPAAKRLLRELASPPDASAITRDRAAQIVLALQAVQRTVREQPPTPADVLIEQRLRELSVTTTITPGVPFQPIAFASQLKRLCESLD